MAQIPGLESYHQGRVDWGEIAGTLRAIDLHVSNPTTLAHLWQIFAPLLHQIPELGLYSLESPEGQREFPRTATGLAIFGSFLRACDAMEVLARPATLEKRHEARTRLHREFKTFTAPQRHEERLSYGQYIEIIKLFQPYADDVEAVATIAVALTYQGGEK